MKVMARTVVMVLLGAAALGTIARAAPADTVADRVLGQANFTDSRQNGAASAGAVRTPNYLTVDPSSGRLYVADTLNSRVLSWPTASAFVNGQAADLVIGQPDFLSTASNRGGTGPAANTLSGPAGLTVDGSGRLLVADDGNNRVLMFESPATTDTVADGVFGQAGSFTSDVENIGGGVSADGLRRPHSVAVSGTTVFITDLANHRVLAYDSPFTTNTTADAVLGQANLTSNASPQPPTATSVRFPQDATIDGSGNLYVADTVNNRVLQYTPPFVNGEAAARVFGQPDFVSNAPNQGLASPSEGTLEVPRGVAVDANDDLYVADSFNSRVLFFDDPLANQTADRVYGQGGVFTTGQTNKTGVNADGLSNADGVAVGPGGFLYVADTSNNRVLRFEPPLTDTTADAVLGQPDLTSSTRTNGAGISFAHRVAVDPASGRIFVSDQSNNRVLSWPDAPDFANGQPADLVIGQADFTSSLQNGGEPGINAGGFSAPTGLAVDDDGNIYVADLGNRRVLVFLAPLTSGMAASLVFGQGGDLTTGVSNKGGRSADSLASPVDVALDGAGNVYIVDGGNDRVLEYDTPLTTDTTADRVFGQAGAFDTGDANKGGISADSLNAPGGAAVDGQGTLYVSDTLNSRVLAYDAPLTTNTTADHVFGQTGAFDTNTSNKNGRSADSLAFPRGVAADVRGHLYVADQGNQRVLESMPVT